MRRLLLLLLSVLGLMAAASGAAASPSPGSAHPKRGVASGAYAWSAPRRLAQLGTAWTYTWSATPPPVVPGAPRWIPMVWGSGSVTPATLAALRAERRSGRAADLLTFNEPDNPAQADLTPAQAAALWPRLERTGLRLSAPAVATPFDGWLRRFMAIARRRRLRVAFLALHFYQDVTDPRAVGTLRAQLVALHRRYRLPIWITEIGALDIGLWGEPMRARLTEPAAVGYERRLFAMLDGLPFVQRYAWFIDRCTTPDCRDSALFTRNGAVTPVGATFRTAR